MTKQQKKSYDVNWQSNYAEMITTAEEAVGRIHPGDRVFAGAGAAQPRRLLDALCRRSRELPDTEILHFYSLGDAPYALPEQLQSFRVNSFFLSSNVITAVQEGLAEYTPVSISDIPRLFASGEFPLDVALIQVSPPDLNGMCSLGVSVDITKSAAENANLVIAQVNPNMPRTLGNSLINIWDIDLIVPCEEELLEWKQPVLTEEERRIGEYIAGLIDDGATLHFGLGNLPSAVIEYLSAKKDLGIHSGLLSDGIVDLVESGAVSGSKKTLDKSKVVSSFCLGTKKLYDYIDNNPLFSFYPSDYVSDPIVIAQQHQQVAVTEALEVDLSGQVCSDSCGGKFCRGIGGQVDFNWGAAHSIGGKAIIALKSTADDGKSSRIVPSLSSGSGVVITRGDVQYVVTEYGVAYLHGKSIQERALALISIAHPNFRAELLKGAIEQKYLRADLADIESQILIDPPRYRACHTLKDGTQVLFRSIRPTDEPLVRDMFYELSQETIYYRFKQNMKQLPRKELQGFVYVNHRTDVAVAATVPEAHGEAIIGIGRYFLDEKTNLAEVAFIVRDDWQKKGIGSSLLKHLAGIAKRHGIKGFTAEVLKSNRGMQMLFNRSQLQVKSVPRDDVYSYRLEF